MKPSLSLEVTVGPFQLALHQGNGVLLTDQDGQIPPSSDKGFYFFDTRLLSSWSIYANGEPWDLLTGGNISHYACRIFLTDRLFSTPFGVVPARSLGLTIGRWMSGGIHEDLDLANHGMETVRFSL